LTPLGLTTTINERYLVLTVKMPEDLEPDEMCVICMGRRAEPMTFICNNESCFRIFMEYQSKGKLKELFGISQDEERTKIKQ